MSIHAIMREGINWITFIAQLQYTYKNRFHMWDSKISK